MPTPRRRQHVAHHVGKGAFRRATPAHRFAFRIRSFMRSSAWPGLVAENVAHHVQPSIRGTPLCQRSQGAREPGDGDFRATSPITGIHRSSRLMKALPWGVRVGAQCRSPGHHRQDRYTPYDPMEYAARSRTIVGRGSVVFIPKQQRQSGHTTSGGSTVPRHAQH